MIFCPGLVSLRRRVSSHGLRRGSITAEAALAFPIFFMIVICLASIMNVFGNTLVRMSALRDTAETAAIAAAAAGSSEEEQWIDLTVPEYFKPFFLPDGLTGAVIPVRGRVRVWNGRSDGENEAASDTKEEYVYVTDNRSVYHTDSACSHLELSVHGVSESELVRKRNTKGSRYKPCEKCCRGGSGAYVYITDDGDRYHSSPECSGLKRTVKLVPASSVTDLCECQRCAAKRAG